MSGTLTKPGGDLRAKLAQVESEIADLHARRAVASKDATEAKARFAASPRLDIKSAEYREAQAKVDRLREVHDALDDAREVQGGILRMISDSPAGRSKAALNPANVRQPGGWMAATIRQKAVTTSEIGSTEDLGRVFIDRLSERSAILAAQPTVVDVDTTTLRVPVLAGRMDAATPVPELADIPEDEPTLNVVDVEPVKFAKLVQLSTESWTDARAPLLAAHERELVRSIGDGFDAAVFHGAPTAPQPGLAGTSGIATVNATSMVGVDAFVRAIGALRRASATATAIFLGPATWEALGLVKESDTSRKPLIAAELAATDAAAERLLGVRVYVSSAILAGHGFAVDMAEVIVVRRTDVQVDIDPYFGFSRGAVGYRAIFRAKAIVGQPAGVCHITNLPTGA